MKSIKVEVQEDHLQTLSKTRKPMIALSELIWNGLDADASDVRVSFQENALGGLELIRVSDNGLGIQYADVENAFKRLGGSWKRAKPKTASRQRILHGRLGKGRFRAFSLGRIVTWSTNFADSGKVQTFSVTGEAPSLGEFRVSDVTDVRNGGTGTVVEISGLIKEWRSLRGSKAIQDVVEHFALYLRQYGDAAIVYDGVPINPADAEEKVSDYELDGLTASDGTAVMGQLTIIEWKHETERALYLCDADGFALEETPPGVQAPGFNFTAYIKADYLRTLDENGSLVLEDLHPDLKVLLDQAKAKIREHFRQRLAESAATRVEDWKREKVYPYQGEPTTIIERAEREVFEVCALNVSEYLPSFEDVDTKSKRLAFRLLRNALETSPSHLGRILQEVLDLPTEKQEELAQLLERTTLDAIISVSKTVADRLDFLKGLEAIVFDVEIKKTLLERRQLHRIIAEHTWVFGETFHLVNDDDSLTAVLKKHLQLAGKTDADVDLLEPVLREDGSLGVVDLMLSRRIPMPDANKREHLVVELKRPTVKIDLSVLTQVEEYAFAIANDERFRDTDTRWTYWAVSNEMADNARKRARQKGKPQGMVHESDDGRVTIWAKSWGEIVDEARSRLEFFQQELKCSADKDSGLAYLRKMHAKYLPKAAQQNTKWES